MYNILNSIIKKFNHFQIKTVKYESCKLLTINNIYQCI